MSLFLLLIVLVILLLAAIWWNPRRTVSPSVVPNLFASVAGSAAATERDVILNEEIQIIEDLIRQDDADRRRAAALARLADVALTATKRKP